jgi:gliding motility-associated-like protein
VEGGHYTITVKERACNFTTSLNFLHFVIPIYFTPNGDGIHDTFYLVGVEFYNNSEVSIFDRYGKLLISSSNTPFEGDGTFNNQKLPSRDYWYVITNEGQLFKGHFSLKR